jgi:hypothetical protein
MSYNKKTSRQFGWKPEWFGCSDFGDELEKAIASFQQDHNLYPDGMCGPDTFRRVFNERALDLEEFDTDKEYSSYIICHGEPVDIEWDKVILWTDVKGLQAKKGNYREVIGRRDVRMLVNHWDVCCSSKICQRVLDKRGISVHFLIDNDGTIYQTLDTTHVAWHASGANDFTIGVEISNAFYPKYQDWYVEKGFGERPILEKSVVHGKMLTDHLGFYPVQLKALKALFKAVNKGLRIPLETPLNLTGTQYTDRYSKAAKSQYRGFVHHYHLTNKKIDCGGLDLSVLLEEIKNG